MSRDIYKHPQVKEELSKPFRKALMREFFDTSRRVFLLMVEVKGAPGDTLSFGNCPIDQQIRILREAADNLEKHKDHVERRT